MEEKIYHGKIGINELADALMAEFNRPPWKVQKIKSRKKIAIQIATRPQIRSGGQTALTLTLQELPDGVLVQMGQQAWAGLVTSLGTTALSILRNPWNILNRLDDLAQDFENLQLSEQIWQTLDAASQLAGASHVLSETLDKTVCAYCGTANPLDAAHCLACGAPLGAAAPITCPSCGFPVPAEDTVCPKCQRPIRQ